MLCSEWVPSEWVQTSDKNITIIHTTPVHQLTSGEDKRWNKSSIKIFPVEKCICCCLVKIQPHICLELFCLVNAAWSVQISLLIQTRTLFHWRKCYGLWTRIWVKNILMLDLFQLLSSQDVNWWTGVVWIVVMFLSAVWTLILTAPIHCRASIAETLMQWHISTNLMKKQTHRNLGWPEMSTLSAHFEVFL